MVIESEAFAEWGCVRKTTENVSTTPSWISVGKFPWVTAPRTLTQPHWRQLVFARPGDTFELGSTVDQTPADSVTKVIRELSNWFIKTAILNRLINQFHGPYFHQTPIRNLLLMAVVFIGLNPWPDNFPSESWDLEFVQILPFFFSPNTFHSHKFNCVL